MLVTPLPIDMLARLAQKWNAAIPILVTLSGITVIRSRRKFPVLSLKKGSTCAQKGV
jgi:hypothetical protein